jgi:excinuclease UvrABC nuclease subunit
MIRKSEPLNWCRILDGHLASASAPPIAGIYVYANSALVQGLPMTLEWVYVGQANNLKRRFEQHEIFSERNIGLIRWLRGPSHVEVWYVPLPKSQLSHIEQELVRTLKPKYNQIRYERGTKVE